MKSASLALAKAILLMAEKSSHLFCQKAIIIIACVPLQRFFALLCVRNLDVHGLEKQNTLAQQSTAHHFETEFQKHKHCRFCSGIESDRDEMREYFKIIFIIP